MVACTGNGKVKINLDLVKEMSTSYLDRIKRLEETLSRHYGDGKEASCTVNLSLEFERYGDFLLESGLIFMAFRNYIKAASVCTSGSDLCWADTNEGYLLRSPYRGRFLEMFFKIKNLVKADGSLKVSFIQSGLEKEYLSVTACQRAWCEEFNEIADALQSDKMPR